MEERHTPSFYWYKSRDLKTESEKRPLLAFFWAWGQGNLLDSPGELSLPPAQFQVEENSQTEESWNKQETVLKGPTPTGHHSFATKFKKSTHQKGLQGLSASALEKCLELCLAYNVLLKHASHNCTQGSELD